MLLALTVIDFVALGLILVHAMIITNYQIFPACLYILTGDSMAGLSTSPSQRSTPGVITISLTTSNNTSSQQSYSSYSAPAAHIYMLVLSTTLLLVMLHVCKFIKWILFGQLRVIEHEHLYEWAWMSASECFLAMTIFRDELDAKFVICFAGLLAVKAFHWITRDRVDFMEQSATRLERDFFIRISIALGLLIAIDVYCVSEAVEYSILHGASMNLLFANEFMLLVISWTSTCIRFILNTREHRQGKTIAFITMTKHFLGHPWEEKSQRLLYVDVMLDFSRLITYSFFFAVVFSFYGLPLHLIRELYLTASSFIRRVTELLRYRRAVIHLDQTYPTLEQRDLESMPERTCIVCREEISVYAGANNTDKAKKLPCGHVFHFKCLRSWLERQQACPTCRRPLLTIGKDNYILFSVYRTSETGSKSTSQRSNSSIETSWTKLDATFQSPNATTTTATATSTNITPRTRHQ